MKNKPELEDMQPSYDFKNGVRGKFAERYKAGVSVRIIPDEKCPPRGDTCIGECACHALKPGDRVRCTEDDDCWINGRILREIREFGSKEFLERMLRETGYRPNWRRAYVEGETEMSHMLWDSGMEKPLLVKDE